MSVHAFILERRPVMLAGRRFILRRPTVATVELFLALFGVEVGVLLDNKGQQLGGVDVYLPLFTLRGDSRMLHVLATCVESDEPLEHWPVLELASAVASMTDIGRIVASLGLRRGAPARKTSAREERAAILRLAHKFGVTPFDVMNWPMDGYLDILDALPLMDGRGEGHTQHSDAFMDQVRKAARKLRASDDN